MLFKCPAAKRPSLLEKCTKTAPKLHRKMGFMRGAHRAKRMVHGSFGIGESGIGDLGYGIWKLVAHQQITQLPDNPIT